MVIVAWIYLGFYIEVGVGTFLPTPTPPEIPSDSTALVRSPNWSCQSIIILSNCFLAHVSESTSELFFIAVPFQWNHHVSSQKLTGLLNRSRSQTCTAVVTLYLCLAKQWHWKDSVCLHTRPRKQSRAHTHTYRDVCLFMHATQKKML
jgi:hypothetical protein